jgi:hypothetical protein
MIVNVQFEENDVSFKADFGEVQTASDGGYERGYEAGLKKGHSNGYTEGKADGFEEGKESGNSLYYTSGIDSLFAKVVFPENYSLTLRLKELKKAYQTFYQTQNLKSVKIIVDDRDSPIPLSQTFRESSIEIVDLSECSRKLTVADYLCFNASNLKTIIGALDLSECTHLPYSFFAPIEDIEFVPYTIKVNIRFNSKNLTEKSRQSIIDGLADLTGSEAQTITLDHAKSQLTDAQKAQIAAKNWILA